MQFFPVRFHGALRALAPYFRLLRLHQPAGIWLLLWPCWWSIGLATPPGRFPSLMLLSIFALGATLMRGAGCIVNDLLDRRIDAQVARTRARPLASGELQPLQALGLLAGLLLLAACLLLFLNRLTQILALCSLLPVAAYPLMKRFFPCPQLVLGLTFSWGALMGWTAVTGQFAAPMWLLYAAALCWTIGYDTVYALQDKADDERLGVYSSARLFGRQARRAIGLCYGLAVLFLLLAGLAAGRGGSSGMGTAAGADIVAGIGIGYFPGIFLFALHLLWQVGRLDLAEPHQAMATFRSNVLAGALPFIGIVWS